MPNTPLHIVDGTEKLVVKPISDDMPRGVWLVDGGYIEPVSAGFKPYSPSLSGNVEKEMPDTSPNCPKEPVAVDEDEWWMEGYEERMAAEKAAQDRYRKASKWGLLVLIADIILIIALCAVLVVSSFTEGSWGHRDEYTGLESANVTVVDTDKRVKIACIDTGCDTSNIAFDGVEISSQSGSFVGVDREYAVLEPLTDDIEDKEGHGTATAATLMAGLPNENVELVIIKIAERDKAESEALYHALWYAGELDCDVVLCCFGSDNPNADEAARIEYSDWYGATIQRIIDKGGVFVCSAGNDPIDLDEYCRYPANAPNAITVSAMNKNWECCSWSSWGDNVDFCAPGKNIHYPGGDKDGTSFAAPFVAAQCAYLKLLYPEWGYQEICAALKACSRDLGFEGWDPRTGYGCPNIIGYVNAYKDGTANAKAHEFSFSPIPNTGEDMTIDIPRGVNDIMMH